MISKTNRFGRKEVITQRFFKHLKFGSGENLLILASNGAEIVYPYVPSFSDHDLSLPSFKSLRYLK